MSIVKRNRSGARRAMIRLLVPAIVVWLAIPFGSTQTEANHAGRILEVHPEIRSGGSADPGSGTATYFFTATLMDAQNPNELRPIPAGGVPINIDWEVEGGGNDADGLSWSTPDRTCTVQPGFAECSVSVIGTFGGTSLVRAWIDHQNVDADISEVDTLEGRYAGPTDCHQRHPPNNLDPLHDDGTSCSLDESGDPEVPDPGTTEPDITDVVRATWSRTATHLLDCSPEFATNPQDGPESTENYLCSVVDQDRAPVPNKSIDGEMLGGANDPDDGAFTPADFSFRRIGSIQPNNGCRTDASGSCVIAVTAFDGEVGSSTICFWMDTEEDSPTAQPNDVYDPHGSAQSNGSLCQGPDAEPITLPSGTSEFNNQTDLVMKTWEGRRASGLDAQPETAVNPQGSPHTVTATVFDQFGAVYRGAPVRVNLEFFTGSISDGGNGNSSSAPDRFCDTSTTTGQCAITYTPPATSGSDLMCLWIGNTPAMVGVATTGTCDGEGRVDATSNDGIPTPANDDQDVVEKHFGAGPSPSPSPSPTTTPPPCQTQIHDATAEANYFPYSGFSGGVYLASGNFTGATGSIREIVTGAGEGGGPHIVIADRFGAVQRSFYAYDSRFTGGVRVAAADINGDGVHELVTAPGPGGGPHVRVTTADNQMLRQWMAYDIGFSGGVFIGAADVDGNGDDEVITGPDAGGGPHVRIWDFNYTGVSGTPSVTGHFEREGFMAYEPTFSGGVRVAGGQVTQTATSGDREEVVTAPGPGRDIDIKVYRETSQGSAPQINTWRAYSGFRGGAYVGVGQYDNLLNGEEVITGAGQGGGPHVIAWRNAAAGTTEAFGFMAATPSFNGGVRVASGDVDPCSRAGGSNTGTEEDEIVVGLGPGSAQVRTFR